MKYFTYDDGHFYFQDLKIVGTCPDVAKTLDTIHRQTISGYEDKINYHNTETAALRQQLEAKDQRIGELEAHQETWRELDKQQVLDIQRLEAENARLRDESMFLQNQIVQAVDDTSGYPGYSELLTEYQPYYRGEEEVE